ncbi:MAG: PEP-CTERM sorting domain-containing protein [Thiobacillaceae bacterium]
MKYLTRLSSITLLALSGIGAGTAQAQPIQVVFDNTVNASGSIFGPACCQVGNEITLGGNARRIVQLSWAIDGQNTDIVADIETQIYANDGLGGAPGTLIWDSGLLTGIAVSATDTFLDIAVPEIAVPDIITVTSRFLDSAPVALGRVGGGAPSVGSIDTSWIETSPGVWQQQFGPWALRVSAVPEPSTLSLLIVAGGLLIRSSRCRVARGNEPAERIT